MTLDFLAPYQWKYCLDITKRIVCTPLLSSASCYICFCVVYLVKQCGLSYIRSDAMDYAKNKMQELFGGGTHIKKLLQRAYGDWNQVKS
jgi:hypothetical protein